MRRHGWGGDLPTDDDEARSRILAAARRLIEERPDTAPSISEVAEQLSVTRQTVYRYFPGVQALLIAAVEDGVAAFLDDVAEHLAAAHDPAEAVVECIAFAHEEIQRRPDLSLVLHSGLTSPTEFTSDAAMAFGRSLVDRMAVDWSTVGIEPDELDGLVELMLRTLMSFVFTPGDPPRRPDELRAFLRRWVGPAVTRR